MKALPLLVGGIVLVSSWGGRARRERSGYAGWPLQVAIGWVAGEFIRSFIPALGTWGFVGYAMYRQTWFLQPVAAVGMFGLDVLIVFTNYAIALLVIAMIDRRNVVDGGARIALPVAARWCGYTILALAIWSASSIAMRRHDGKYGKAHPVVFLGGTSISRGTYPTYGTPFGRVAAIICATRARTLHRSGEDAGGISRIPARVARVVRPGISIGRAPR